MTSLFLPRHWMRSATLAGAILLLSGCVAATPAGADLGATELNAMMDSSKVAVVDVREPDEFAAGHIAGAISAPLSSFDCTKLSAPPGKEIVLQCRSGRRSAQALAICQRQGRTDVKRHLGGGIQAWEAAGLPLTQ